MTLQELWDLIKGWAASTGIKIVIAILILIASFTIINIVSRRIKKKLENNKKVDKTLSHTLIYLLRIILKVLVVVGIVGYLGIDTSGVSALVASFGVAVGLAINGTLSNFAGGVMILITRPFKDDDYISAMGAEGTVEAIRIIHTKIRTPDNKVVYLPNGTLSTSNITNYTEKGTRRVDSKFYISYETDFKLAESIIYDVCASNEHILKEPKVAVGIAEHGESSIVIFCKAWCKSEDYWTVYNGLMEDVKTAFDEKGITIPFNQLDVHIKND